ncbi:MAG: hypothetical protein ACREA9_10950 [Pyrinomonadaceae bacterium]
MRDRFGGRRADGEIGDDFDVLEWLQNLLPTSDPAQGEFIGGSGYLLAAMASQRNFASRGKFLLNNGKKRPEDRGPPDEEVRAAARDHAAKSQNTSAVREVSWTHTPA